MTRPYLVVVLAGVFLATACTEGTDGSTSGRDDSFEASVVQVTCPHDVAQSIDYLDGTIATDATCWYLTVLENRADPDGRTIHLFFVRVPPPDGEPEGDPWLHAYGGFDLARTNGYDSAGTSESLHRETISMDLRGIGLSEPNLACPEVQNLALPTSDTPLTSNMGQIFLNAVQACRNRLSARGIDLAAYNLAEMAADAEDLRVALGIDEWNLGMFGTASSVGFEILRRYPEHVRSAVFDSPAAPQVDLFTQAVVGTEYSVGELAKTCAAQPTCHRVFPDVEQAWRQALERLHEEPTRIGARLGYGVIIDDVAAVRMPQPADIDVLRAIHALSPIHRAVIVLYYFEDRPVAEVADITGLSHGASKVALHRARKRLAQLLGEDEPVEERTGVP